MNILNKLMLSLLIIGGLNRGFVGLFQYDSVAAIFGGSASLWSRIIYTLVGISGLYCISMLFYHTEDHLAVSQYQKIKIQKRSQVPTDGVLASIFYI